MELRKVWGNRPLIIVCVGVLIQDEIGRILLQRRGDDGLWGEPGGALDPGEDFLTAARRELLEETGLVCPDLHLLPIAEGLQGGPEFFSIYPNGHEVYIVGMRAQGTLAASALDHAAPDDSGETLELRWFALDDLPPISKNVNRLSLSLLRGRVGLPPLPLEPTPPAPPTGNHLGDLRKLVGHRPLHAPGSNVLVTDKQGRLLLLRHGGTGKWTVPGGSLEPGETFEACARRELFEETGLSAATLEPLEMLCGPDYRFTYLHGDVVDNVSVLYRAQGVSGELIPQEGEVLEVGWFGVDELPPDEELSGALIRDNLRIWKRGQSV
ncbi:NUDIX domain-containing protein [Deinococcus arenicola]|uniref:NUDIX domain-containing protein n=1 Tax=Deinococcus arenicola TaxID=2994950 RepID=A0ABU4DLN8_9DEIO|nr:NUDIX domain-containing protein [Deinococcus sp. ZS9-10]MDV6373332.1 NUDIX domain-containing protein [Deinococcus sp. ZS9-10]